MAGSEINSLYLKNNNYPNAYINNTKSYQHNKKTKDHTENINPDYLVDISITARMKANHYSMVQALKDNKNSRKMLDTIQNYLNQLSDLVQTIRIQNNRLENQSLPKEESVSIQIELSELIDEIDRISSQASYNKIKLLDGNFSKINPLASMWIQLSHKPEHRTRLYLATMTSKAMQLAISPKKRLNNKKIDSALEKISEQQKKISQVADNIQKHNKNILAELYKLIKSKNIIIDNQEINRLLKIYEEDFQ